MKYEHSIELFSGDTILITAEQMESIKQALQKGSQWISCGEEFINAKNIASIGTHRSTAHMRKIKQSTNETKLAGINPSQHKKLLAIKKEKAINSARNEEKEDYEKLVGKDIKELPQSDKEVIDGEPAFYIDENGEKMYS